MDVQADRRDEDDQSHRNGFRSLTRRQLLSAGAGVAAATAGAGMLSRPGEVAAAGVVAAADRDATVPKPLIEMVIVGKVQGAFDGDSKNSAKTAVFTYHYEVMSPYNATNGGPSGRRQHKPVTITKQISPCTTQIMQAAATSEVLTVVNLQWLHTNSQGKLTAYFDVVLTNATTVSVDQYYTEGDATGAAAFGALTFLEEVSFLYERITVTNLLNHAVFTDSWV